MNESDIIGRIQEQGAPIVSVVTPFLNTRKYLGEAVRSVQAQSLGDWELLLVDDGATDGTDEIARRFAEEDERIRYLHHPGRQNLGISATRNLGLRLARAPCVAQVDSDDVLLPSHLETHVDALRKHPEAAMVFGPVERWYSWSEEHDTSADFVARPLDAYGATIDPPDLLPLLLGRKYAVPLGYVCRTEAVRSVGGYEDTFPGLYDDQVFLAKLALEYPVHVLREWTYRYRRHPESIVSVVGPSDESMEIRRRFLDWLRIYLRENEVRAPEVWATLRRESWRARYPALADLVSRGVDLVRRASGKARRVVRMRAQPLIQAAADRGLPPHWLGYRAIRKISLAEILHEPEATRHGVTGNELIHPRARYPNALPRNISDPGELPADKGWWGYSMRDVSTRWSADTRCIRLKDATVLPFIDPAKEYFRPAILTRRKASLELREVSFRNSHVRMLRDGPEPVRADRVAWILERVYDNHSHWLTAHVPKLILLRDRELLGDVYLPPRLSRVMETSIRLLGLDPAEFPTFIEDRPLVARELMLFSTDRFRPELLQSVRRELGRPRAAPRRRVYVSRAKAARRRLLNEDEIWPMLEGRGFERVFFEDLPFERQVDLMGETRILLAPHGAGLTNILFCPPGTHVLEIADLGFPNPNFYAIAAALDHPYWLLEAAGVGDVHPLEKDLRVEPDLVRRTVDLALDGLGS